MKRFLFVALGSGEEIVMQDNMRIVQAEVPHTMLASMGISVRRRSNRR